MAGATIGQAYIQILPSMKGVSAAVSREMNMTGRTAGKSAGNVSGHAMGKNIVKSLVASGVVAGVAKIFKTIISEGAKLEQSTGGIETLFKKSSGTVIKNANRAWKTAGMSANEYMEQTTSFSASLLQSLGGDTKKAAAYADMAVRDMSDNANKMGTDMGTITQTYQSFARGNYAMLDNLKLGYGGTKKEMERLLQDAQKITGQKYDISNLSDVYSAIHVVQGELGITGTTSKEAASTLSGSFASMKAAATNFAGYLVTGNAADITRSLGDLVKSIGVFLGKNLLPAIGRVLVHIGKLLVQKIPELSDKAIKGIQKMIAQMDSGDNSGTKAGLKIAGKIALGILKGIGKIGLALLKLSWALTALALAALGKLLATLMQMLGGKIGQLMSFIGGKIKGAFATAGAGILNAILSPFRLAAAGAKAIWGGMKGAAVAAWGGIKSAASTIWGGVKGTVTKAAGGMKTGVGKAWGGIKSVTGKVFGGVKNTVGKAMQQTKQNNAIQLRAMYKAYKKNGGGIKGVVAALSTGVRGTFKRMYNALNSMTGGRLGKMVKTFRRKFNSMKDAVSRTFGKIKSIVKGALDKIKGFFKRMIPTLKIKVPHIRVHGGKLPWGIGGKGKKPSIDVDYYAKGAIFRRPTLLGGNSVVGEAGAEAVLPLTKLWSQFDVMADSIVNGVMLAQQAAAGAGGGDVHVSLYLYPNGPKMDEFIVHSYDRGKRKGLK